MLRKRGDVTILFFPFFFPLPPPPPTTSRNFTSFARTGKYWMFRDYYYLFYWPCKRISGRDIAVRVRARAYAYVTHGAYAVSLGDVVSALLRSHLRDGR